MAHYILLMTLSPVGRARMLEDPNHIVQVQEAIHVSQVTGLGMYAVLGAYDFVSIVEAPDNDAAARYSLKLGVEVGAHVETLPAVPIGLLLDRDEDVDPSLLKGVELGAPGEER